jgi:hypothetical protein
MSATPKPAEEARSKILRLSFADRMIFNAMVRERYTGKTLIQWLTNHGVPGVTPPNLTRYKRSPAYRAWLSEETLVARDQQKAENAMRLAVAIGGSCSDRLKGILAGSLYKSMPDADPDNMKPMVNALRAITDAERLEIERRADQRKEAQFRRDSLELFKQWYADAHVAEIMANQSLSSEARTQLLGRQLFGEDWG